MNWHVGTPLALFSGMETSIDAALDLIIEKARKDENLPESGLPTLGALIDAYVSLVLDATSHNVARSARILDISRSTLYHHLAWKGNPRRVSPFRGASGTPSQPCD